MASVAVIARRLRGALGRGVGAVRSRSSGSTPMAARPASVTCRRMARPSSSFRQMRLSAASALAGCRSCVSAISPRESSAPTTLVAAPPRSEPGSGRTLRSSRCAAALRIRSWVSESLVMGWSPVSAPDHPGLLPPRAALPVGARQVRVMRDLRPLARRVARVDRRNGVRSDGPAYPGKEQQFKSALIGAEGSSSVDGRPSPSR